MAELRRATARKMVADLERHLAELAYDRKRAEKRLASVISEEDDTQQAIDRWREIAEETDD